MSKSRVPRESPAATDPLTLSSSGARELALTDDLTGAHNRRFLRRLFEKEWAGLLERHGRITLLLIDLDLFKEVNDRYGHSAGDVVLRAVAARLSESFRDEDRLIRYGGDEFVVVLPGAGPSEARSLAERARQALRSDRWNDPLTGSPVEVPVSYSIGVASAPVDGASGDTVLVAADRRLYEEKKSRHLEATPGRRRSARWILVLALAAVAALALSLALRPQADPASPQPSAAVFEARERARGEAVRREQELADLRAELETLRGRPSVQLSTAERARYERRIRELEAAVESAAERTSHTAAATPAPRPAATPAPQTPGQGFTEHPAAPVADAATPAATAPPPGTRFWIPPQLIDYDPPVYPQQARLRGLEAEVEVTLRIGAAGEVIEASLAGPGAGFGFDEAALVAARSARYRPGRLGGVARVSTTSLRIVFRIGEGGRR